MTEVIKRAIRDRGENVTRLAKGAGVPQPVLHRFVAGERDLTLRTAEKLAAYLGLELRARATD